MKVFVHHDGALGDVLLSLASIRQLSADGADVHFAGRRDIGALLLHAGLVQAVSASGDARYAPLYGGCSGAAGFLEHVDRAVVFTSDIGSGLVKAVRGVVRDTVTVMTVPPPGRRISVAAYRLEQLAPGLSLPTEPLLPVPRRFSEQAGMLLRRAGWDGMRPVVAFHPGSGGKAKCWPLEKYLGVMESLLEGQDICAAVLTGPAEEGPVSERIAAFARSRSGVLHCRDAELITAAALLGLAGLSIGNDSGISHLAAAVGCRCIVLFGPTDPALWSPVGHSVAALAASPLEGLPVAAVLDRINDALRTR